MDILFKVALLLGALAFAGCGGVYSPGSRSGATELAGNSRTAQTAAEAEAARREKNRRFYEPGYRYGEPDWPFYTPSWQKTHRGRRTAPRPGRCTPTRKSVFGFDFSPYQGRTVAIDVDQRALPEARLDPSPFGLPEPIQNALRHDLTVLPMDRIGFTDDAHRPVSRRVWTRQDAARLLLGPGDKHFRHAPRYRFHAGLVFVAEVPATLCVQLLRRQLRAFRTWYEHDVTFDILLYDEEEERWVLLVDDQPFSLVFLQGTLFRVP